MKLKTTIDESKKSRRRTAGRPALSEEDARTTCISVRLNQDELAWLNSARGKHKKGEYLRMAAMNKIPAVIPEANLELRKNLSRIAININTIAKHANAEIKLHTSLVIKLLQETAQLLIEERVDK